MLIRSQNREVLINLNSMAGIEIAEGPIKTIITSYITGCSYLLGEYSDKEKVFKVLDMIQEAYADAELNEILLPDVCKAVQTVKQSAASAVRSRIPASADVMIWTVMNMWRSAKIM